MNRYTDSAPSILGQPVDTPRVQADIRLQTDLAAKMVFAMQSIQDRQGELSNAVAAIAEKVANWLDPSLETYSFEVPTLETQDWPALTSRDPNGRWKLARVLAWPRAGAVGPFTVVLNLGPRLPAPTFQVTTGDITSKDLGIPIDPIQSFQVSVTGGVGICNVIAVVERYHGR